jgi:hypothetical protein
VVEGRGEMFGTAAASQVQADDVEACAEGLFRCPEHIF